MNNPAGTAYNGINGHTTYWYQPVQAVLNSNVVIPEVDKKKNKPDYLKMDSTDSLKLLSLLSKWKMGFLFKTFYEALVDIEALKYITPPQCHLLLNNYPLGIRIKFVGKLMDWKQQLTLAEDTDNTADVPALPNTQ